MLLHLKDQINAAAETINNANDQAKPRADRIAETVNNPKFYTEEAVFSSDAGPYASALKPKLFQGNKSAVINVAKELAADPLFQVMEAKEVVAKNKLAAFDADLLKEKYKDAPAMTKSAITALLDHEEQMLLVYDAKGIVTKAILLDEADSKKRAPLHKEASVTANASGHYIERKVKAAGLDAIGEGAVRRALEETEPSTSEAVRIQSGKTAKIEKKSAAILA